jgi:glycosyltransferase involved in cell wall biosynthesis
MNVACLMSYPLDHVPAQRFRVEQWAPHLSARGITLDFLPFLEPPTMRFLHKPGHFFEKSRDVLTAMARRAAWTMRHVDQYDAVVIHREAMMLGVDLVERYVSKRVPTVFDFDDAIWIHAVTPANRHIAFLKGFEKTNRTLGWVTSVSAGCEFLATQARKFNDDVHIVPTSIELEKYSPPRVHAKTDVLHVGWTGSLSSARYLNEIKDAMAKAAKRIKMKLTVVGTRGFEIPGVDVECVDWTPETEVPIIRTFDVGLKPAAIEEWALGKCPMKDIQYMALGIPCVATNFGTAKESITHGVNGFLCDRDDDWVDALVQLQDVQRREAMGIAGRKTVEQRYSSIVAAHAFADTIESAVKRFSGKRRSTRASGPTEVIRA